MDHPVRAQENLEVRKKLAKLLKSNYDLVRHDSIVFVCGGNKPRGARMRFLKIAPAVLQEYDFFTPETALKSPWRDREGPFELTSFETLIAEVSAAVVVFPESPGSFCEVGFFVAKEKIRAKTILAIDSRYQTYDSFISTGPLHLINQFSDFRPAEYVDYRGDFQVIMERIKKRHAKAYRRSIRVNKYRDLSFVQKMGIVQKVVEILTLATREDIQYIFRSMFSSHTSPKQINAFISILCGSGYLVEASNFGHFYANKNKPSFLEVSNGSQGLETEIKFTIAEISEGSIEFKYILEELQNVA